MVATRITVVFGVQVLRSKVNKFLGLLDEEALQAYEEENYGEEQILASNTNICSYPLPHDAKNVMGDYYTIVGIALCEINIERHCNYDFMPNIDSEQLKKYKYQWKDGLNENKDLHELTENKQPSIWFVKDNCMCCS